MAQGPSPSPEMRNFRSASQAATVLLKSRPSTDGKRPAQRMAVLLVHPGGQIRRAEDKHFSSGPNSAFSLKDKGERSPWVRVGR